MAFWSKDKKQESAPASAPKHAEVGRNDPCHCGSGKKYKKCHMAQDDAAEHKVLEENWTKAEAAAKAEAEKNAKEAAKQAKEAPATQAPKHSGTPTTSKQQHPTFVPTQVNLPRKSGGG
jgi:septal ring factor EnvC (AmiA/AmiB activator)